MDEMSRRELIMFVLEPDIADDFLYETIIEYAFESEYEDVQGLKNRLKALKKVYRMYYNLASKSSWGWDEEKSLPIAPSEEHWADMIERNPEARSCRDKPFELYNTIEILHGKNFATGSLAGSSTMPDRSTSPNHFIPSQSIQDDNEDDVVNLDEFYEPMLNQSSRSRSLDPIFETPPSRVHVQDVDSTMNDISGSLGSKKRRPEAEANATRRDRCKGGAGTKRTS